MARPPSYLIAVASLLGLGAGTAVGVPYLGLLPLLIGGARVLLAREARWPARLLDAVCTGDLPPWGTYVTGTVIAAERWSDSVVVRELDGRTVRTSSQPFALRDRMGRIVVVDTSKLDVFHSADDGHVPTTPELRVERGDEVLVLFEQGSKVDTPSWVHERVLDDPGFVTLVRAFGLPVLVFRFSEEANEAA